MDIPSNIIVAWSGSVNEIPDGWRLCDGFNNTPDLRNRFIVGAGQNFGFNSTGGSEDAILPIHNHTGGTNNAPNHFHNVPFFFGFIGTGFAIALESNLQFGVHFLSTSSGGNHSHTVSVANAGVGETGVGKNMPPYYALAYIMKV